MTRTYDEHKQDVRRRAAQMSVDGRKIPPIPPVADPVRRCAAEHDFRLYCETYHSMVFALAWSADHLKVIGMIEDAILRGGLFSVAMPRGGGKTSLCECACLWALLYGHRHYVALIAADAGLATQILDSLKMNLEANEMLLADFPEVCFPIHALDGISHRCKGQITQDGERTCITWTADEIVLPTIPGSVASGSIVSVAGITGRIRGMKHARADGSSIRPDLVIVDDPQTDESANSASQCATRERTLAGAVLGLAGPGKKISGIMPCTVIRPGDMADRILSRDLHPEWNGVRCKMLYSMPSNVALWDRYASLRAESMKAGNRGEEATEFYRANQIAMDDGARPAWAERFNADELSAVQNAMNLRLQNEAAFWSEYQNEPLPTDTQLGELTADEIASRLNRLPRSVAPNKTTVLTAFIDVQQDLLYYAVCAWRQDFTGAVIEYGAWPDQKRAYIELRKAKPTLSQVTGIASLEGSLFAALTALVDQLTSQRFAIDCDGGELRIERLLIDAGWGMSTETVYDFIRQSPHGAILTPSHGKGLTAAVNPMDEWPRKQGEKRGLNWIQPVPRPGRVRHTLFDANYWKSFIHARLSVPIGEASSMTLYGEKSQLHRMLADHLTAETKTRTSGRGRDIDEWRLRPHKPDNHLFDCVIGCSVAASMQGVAIVEKQGAPKARRKVDYAEMQRKAREMRRR